MNLPLDPMSDNNDGYSLYPPEEGFVAVQNNLGIERLGEILRGAREKRDEDLRGIAKYLRIRYAYLVALEESAFDKLPADVYAIGFLRTYAEYLGLDSKDMIERYRREMVGRRNRPVLNVPTGTPEVKAPTTAIMIGAISAAIFIYIIWYALSSSNRAEVSKPQPLPTTIKELPVAAASPTPAAAMSTPQMALSPIPAMTVNGAGASATPVATTVPAPTTIPAPTTTPVQAIAVGVAVKSIPTGNENLGNIALAPPLPILPPGKVFGDLHAATHIVIVAEKEAWVLVANEKGRTVFERILKPGESYRVPTTSGLTLTTGNGAGITLYVDGKPLPPLSNQVRVINGIPLDPETLKSSPPKADNE